MTDVFMLGDGWHAIWHDRTCPATFNSKGAALAWIASCNAAGRFRW
jgi:hypothetical protein